MAPIVGRRRHRMPSIELLKALRNALLAEQEKRMKLRGLRKLCKSQRPVIMIEYVRGRICAHGLGDEAADIGDGGV
jgi:hypothetical protein